jgi:hypothetical protein
MFAIVNIVFRIVALCKPQFIGGYRGQLMNL